MKLIVPGHAFSFYERSEYWNRATGTHIIASAACECGEMTSHGVQNISAARQWHREHKAELEPMHEGNTE